MPNIKVGAYLRRDEMALPGDLEGVSALLSRFKESRNQKFGSLSGGEQQMPAIGRALMGRPRLLMIE